MKLRSAQFSVEMGVCNLQQLPRRKLRATISPMGDTSVGKHYICYCISSVSSVRHDTWVLGNGGSKEKEYEVTKVSGGTLSGDKEVKNLSNEQRVTAGETERK